MSGSIFCLPIAPTPELLAVADQLPTSVIPNLPADWHVTLLYVPNAELLTPVQHDALDRIGALIAGMHAPLTLTLTSIHQFDPEADGMAAVVVLIDSVACAALRQALLLASTAAGIPVDTTYPVFVPHITLGYATGGTIADQALISPIRIPASEVGLWVGVGRVAWALTGTKARPRVGAIPRITGGEKSMPPAIPAGCELKAAPHYTKSIDGRTVTGVFSVTGNTDAYSDIIEVGAFRKTFLERGNQVLHLWQHDCDEPPIARVESLRELRRDELPEQIRTQHPDATGGAEVTRTYLPTPRADEVLSNIVAGVPLQMSFMFDAVTWRVVSDPFIRYISEIRLWETSDVNWGANSATMASKRFGTLAPMALTMALTTLDRELTELKAGGRHSAADVKLINTIHKQIVDLGCSTCAGDLADAADSAAKALILADQLQSLIGADTELIQKMGLSPLARTLQAVVLHTDPTESETRTDDSGRAADEGTSLEARTPAPALISTALYQQRMKAAQAALLLATRRLPVGV